MTAEKPGRAFSDRSDADQAMERYADGDANAFLIVYDAIAAPLAAYVGRNVGDRSLANDIVQQAFLNIHRSRGTFARGAAVMPWAFAIARRLIIDAVRAGRRINEEALDPSLAATMVAMGEDLVHARDGASRVAEGLTRLPTSQRRAFQLVQCDGLSLIEAARTLGITATAVKLRVRRAMFALRAILQRDFRP